MLDYPVILERAGDGRILVDFPDFPEAHTYGDTKDEALMRAQDALATIIDAYIRDRQPIPTPSDRRRTPRVRVPALTAAKVALYRAMRDAKVTKTALAKRLGWHLPQVDRLFDVQHGSRLDQLEAAATVLGKQMWVALVDPPNVRQRVTSKSRAASGVGGRRPRRDHPRANRAAKRK